MTVRSSKRDQAITQIFGQLEALRERALDIEEVELAADLSTAFAKALVRYCDRNDVDIAMAVDNTFADLDKNAS